MATHRGDGRRGGLRRAATGRRQAVPLGGGRALDQQVDVVLPEGVGDAVGVGQVGEIDAPADAEQFDADRAAVGGVVDASLVAEVLAVGVRLGGEADVEGVGLGVVFHVIWHRHPSQLTTQVSY